ncbi:MAG TPA: hypothetical protein PKE12_07590 [Kiritimatiellia bacterium]|nr:hypothetical protein [Kiritimatiellia bacterium]
MRTLFTLFIGFALLAPTARADFSADLLAAYFFNGTADDHSGRGQHAQLVGAEFTTDRHGNPDGALLLDGQGAYAATPVSGKRFPVSFSFWFRLDDRPGLRPYSILDSGIGDAFGHSYVIGSGPNTYNANMVANFAFAKGRWTQVAVTYGEKLKVYMDGALVAERDYTEDDSFVAGNFQIGRHFDSENARYFPGAIDDVLIYARTLDDEEVRQLYEESQAVEHHVSLGAEAKTRLAALADREAPADSTDATPRPILVVASSSAVSNTNAWHVFDGDTTTQWDGAEGQAGWWLAAEFHPPLTLSALEIQHAKHSITNALPFYSMDAEQWPDLNKALESGPVTARFLLLTFPADDTGGAPKIGEIRITP